MEHKVITKPFENKDEIDKSRNVTGIHKWARSSRTIGFIMLVLGWFTIPFEVLFRRDFGQRWFTMINYYAGLVLVVMFFALQVIYATISEKLSVYFSWLSNFNPFNETPESIESGKVENLIMLCFCVLYIFMGLYHLFKIKWRSRANIPLHSFDDGTSRLWWLSYALVWVLNIVAVPLMGLCFLLIPPKQRRGKPFPKFISDRQAFTNTTFEPAVICGLAWECSNITSVWLYISGFALLIHAHWKEIARKNKILDFQDSRIEAAFMRELRNRQAEVKTSAKKSSTAKPSKQTQKTEPQVVIQYPNLTMIIEEMNRGKVQFKNQI